ncbi:MAG: hypothetical protein KGM24_15340, partial [Elusimicrobia bacterium]|nr:hypothetical protein [Elusimicrobiota bacterium]
PAVAASTAPAAPPAEHGGIKKAGAPKPKPAPGIRAKLLRESRTWKPLSLRAVPAGAAVTKVERRLEKVKGRYRGTTTSARAIARVHREGPNRLLVVSVFPRTLGALLDRRHPHFELRFRVDEGYLDAVTAALVTVSDPRGAGLDSDELAARGIPYETDTPASGEVLLSALDARASRSAVNAGILRHASFASPGVGLADVWWSVRGARAR